MGEAYEYLKDFKPRRRLAGHDFLNTVVSNVHNSVRSDIVQEAAQRFYRAMKRKPQPYELVKFVRSKVDPPIDTTEAYEYLKDFKPRRRLAGHDFLNTVVSNVHNSVRSDI